MANTPLPVPPLSLTRVTLPSGSDLHRIHPLRYAGDAFNSSTAGNARFSPISDAAGKPIPTIYAGSSFNCAAMETVFHDIPFGPGYKSLEISRFAEEGYSGVQTTCDLILVDLRSIPLRKLGIKRDELIDTEKDQYDMTRKWAQAIHAEDQEAQGMLWVSRQDDDSKAFVFFGDRCPANALAITAPTQQLLDGHAIQAAVFKLARSLGTYIQK